MALPFVIFVPDLCAASGVMVAAPGRRRGIGKLARNAQPLDAETIADERPDAARRDQHGGDGNGAQRHQIPAARERKDIGQQLAYSIIDRRADDRAFERADAADDHDEDHRHHPVEIEAGGDGDEQRRHEADAAGKAAAGGGGHIGDEAIAPDIDADAGGGDVVVAHAQHAEPQRRMQERIDADHDSGGERRRDPEIRQQKGLVVDPARGRKRHAGDVAKPRRDEHQHGDDFGEHPGADREIRIAQAEQEKRAEGADQAADDRRQRQHPIGRDRQRVGGKNRRIAAKADKALQAHGDEAGIAGQQIPELRHRQHQQHFEQ